jgi:hypothetical protein
MLGYRYKTHDLQGQESHEVSNNEDTYKMTKKCYILTYFNANEGETVNCVYA